MRQNQDNEPEGKDRENVHGGKARECAWRAGQRECAWKEGSRMCLVSRFESEPPERVDVWVGCFDVLGTTQWG